MRRRGLFSFIITKRGLKLVETKIQRAYRGLRSLLFKLSVLTKLSGLNDFLLQQLTLLEAKEEAI